jgi:hypothetical protein
MIPAVLGALFAATLFLSSALLFALEPIVGKSLLPVLGGGAAVWTTTAAFFQVALLVGYAYAHALSRAGARRAVAAGHVAALVFAVLVLARAPSVAAPPVGGAFPALWLFATLARTVGVPFVLVAASTPLLHAWLSTSVHADARDPYFLFAASNAGSLVALLAYPTLIEPAWGLARQRHLWQLALWPLAVLLAACAAFALRTPGVPGVRALPPSSPTASMSVAPTRLRWLLLAAVPSSLLLSVTSYATTDLAPLPLLWVLPLALYLLTFIIAFARRPIVSPARVLALQPFFLTLIAVEFFLKTTGPTWPLIPVHAAAFFVLALGCHQTLAASRPPAERSTTFYLWVAAGGALGGLFNVLLAPLAFRTLLEYPLGLIAAALLRPRGPAWSPAPRERRLDLVLPLAVAAGLLVTMLASSRLAARPGASAAPVLVPLIVPLALAGAGAYAFRGRPLRFGLALAAICGVGLLHDVPGARIVMHARSFYGVHTVADSRAPLRTLANGATVHGAQSLDSARRREPLTYYHPTGPIGAVMTAWAGHPQRRRVGVIGLGAGALAAYSSPGEHWTFFELDPAVAAIARDPRLFTYLAEARGETDVVVGDARRTLADVPDGAFGMLVLDAFSSDVVPAHLLTREALALYLRKLAPGGVMALHLSNRFIDLEPIVSGAAAALGLVPRACADRASPAEARAGKSPSLWAVVARDASDLAPLDGDRRWRPARAGVAEWTDDRSDLWSSVHLRASEVLDLDALAR